MDVITAIKQRTSYRGLYKESIVPKEDLKKIMEAGLAAPSGCNKQTTSLIAVDDKEILKKLYTVITPAVGETAPAMICVLTEKTLIPGIRSYNIQDYSAAIQNMLLTTIELGYETCWYEGIITDEISRAMADILGVPTNYDLVCFLPIGVAAEPIYYIEKKPFQQRAWFNEFGKNN